MLRLKKGLRIVRGPDWCLGNDDGGEGFTGILSSVDGDTKTVTVKWDNGNQSQCRTGHMKKYDLRIIDNAQIGIIHTGITCDECNFRNIRGMRFKCNNCFDYDLCSECYHQDRHNLSHTFRRILFLNNTGIDLPPRSISRKIQLKGLFKGAKVIPGIDWNKGHTNQAIHRGVTCDECSKENIQGLRYNCENCYNYDLCSNCYDDGKHDLSHCFMMMESPNSVGIELPPRSFSEVDSFGVTVHPGFQCDECVSGEYICGTRYMCNSCFNYDLCETCYKNGRHDLSHSFRMIKSTRSEGTDLPPRSTSHRGNFNDAVHIDVQCDECDTYNICGNRYKCNDCRNYDLCFMCYNKGKHDLNHGFKMIKSPYSKGVDLPPRSTRVRDENASAFTVADGNEVTIGTILKITSWKNQTQWSAAYVEWSDGRKQFCRVGHQGYCDIQFIEAASRGQYYPEHLPILGKSNEIPDSKQCLNENKIWKENVRKPTENTQKSSAENVNETFNFESISLNEATSENSAEPTTNIERVKYLERKVAELEERQMCEICLETRRNIIFLCGHGTCSNCAENLQICHLCRQTIKNKIRIY